MLAILGAVALDCAIFWTVRLTLEYQPGTWATVEMSPYTTEEQTAVAWRKDVLQNGYVWPNPMSTSRSEVRSAPGAIKFASVKQLCCTQPAPPEMGLVCTYPNHYPPPAP